MTRDSYEMSGPDNRLSRGNSLFGTEPQEQLRNALKNYNYLAFRKLLTSSSVDPEFCYGYPDFKTCLDIAASEPSKTEFLKLLLQNGANVNRMNETHSAAAIHFAVENANKEALKHILENDQVDVNLKSKGKTALLLAINNMKDLDDDKDTQIKDYEEIIKMLLIAGCDANAPDLKGITPVYSAAKQGLENVIQLIIDYSISPIDLDTYTDRTHKTSRTILSDKYPWLLDKFDNMEILADLVDENKLFNHLSRHDDEAFVKDFATLVKRKEHKSVLAANNGSYTMLQMASDKGLEKSVQILLDSGSDPNATAPGNNMRPVFLACSNGYYKILKLFAENDNTLFDAVGGESLLEVTAKGMKGSSNNSNINHKECYEILLKHPKISINVNHSDYKDNTALHYAARNGDENMVLELLRNGACIGLRNKFDEPPLADIKPKTLETFLDECLTTNSERPSDEDYEIHMNYSFLVYPKNSLEAEVSKPLIDSTNNNTSQAFESILAPETDALLYMTTNGDLKPLLKHPVITSFLYMKWQRISCMFYANITFYALFWLCLILYILLDYGVDMKQSNYIEGVNTLTYIGSIAGLITLMLREFFQLLVSPRRYLKSVENWIEIVLVIVTATILFRDSASESTKQQLSAVAILLSSTELVLLIGQFPSLSTNIVMLRTVSWNFFKFLLWYCILIIAFALSFYTLFRKVATDESQTRPDPNNTGDEDDDDFFLDPGKSLFKTIVMLTGEFDAGSIKFQNFPGTSHIIFIVFVFMIPIVLFNLLNGLAVSDTQAIRADAELVGHVTRVKLISYLENVLLSNVKPYSRTSYPSTMEIFKNKCSSIKMLLIKPLANRICLFPYFLPRQKIIVKPNQSNKIDIPQMETSRKFGDDEDDIEMGTCLLRKCSEYRLDRTIMKHAKEVIAAKSTVNEHEELCTKLNSCSEKIEHLEKLIKNLAKTLETQDRF